MESWTPTYPDGMGEQAPATTKTTIDAGQIELRPWNQIPGLEDVSGIGTYTAQVNLNSWKRGSTCAKLELGALAGGVAEVKVNGRTVDGLDQLDPVLDIINRLHKGENTVTVLFATTLINRLRVSRPVQFGAQTRQDYGLLGPVAVRFYGEARLK